jgi:hypothetical protein
LMPRKGSTELNWSYWWRALRQFSANSPYFNI